MPELTIRGFKGLNLLRSEFERDSSVASDLRNVEIDSRRRLKKRYGFEEFSSVGSFVLNLIPYVRGNKLLCMTPTGPREYNPNTGNFDAIPRGFVGAVPTWTQAVSWVEYNGCIYWSDPTGENPLYKYDGFMFYRAGLTKPDLAFVSVSVPGAPTQYLRAFTQFVDAQGNIINSDYFESTITGTGVATWTYQRADGGFWNKSFYGSGVLGGGSDTINLFAVNESNYVAGDWIYCYTTNNGVVPVKILSTTTTTIVVDPTPLDDLGITHTFGLNGNPETPGQSLLLQFFRSDNVGFGFVRDNRIFLLQHKTPTYNFVSATSLYSVLIAGGISPFMDEEYDTTTVKGIPPIAQYCTLYNNHLVVGGFKKPLFSGSIAADSDADDTLYWSDISVGGSVESFAPFDKEVIGNSGEGGISGLFGSTDVLHVFKESQVYSLAGELFGRGYRIRSALTNEIGCVSHQSITKFSGGVVFMSARGLFYSRGDADPVEFSDVIEELFTDSTLELDLTGTKAAVDFIRERLLFYIPTSGTDETLDMVLVFDYRNKEWLIHDNIHGEGGFAVWNRELYHARYDSPGEVYKHNTGYNDDGVAIRARYYTGWEKAGLYSVLKKWCRAVIYNFSGQTEQIRLVSQHDNDPTNQVTDVTVNLGPSVILEDPEMGRSQSFSMRLGFIHETLDKGFLIDGFDIWLEATQVKPKGEVAP